MKTMNLKKDKDGNEYIEKAGAYFFVQRFVNNQLKQIQGGDDDTERVNKEV